LSEVIRHNPESFEPKRFNMVNYSSSQFDLVNFSPKKQPGEQIRTGQVMNKTATQLNRWSGEKDPGIGVGPIAATVRHDYPCYKEYSISQFGQNGRLAAPNMHSGYQLTIRENPNAFLRQNGMLTTHLDNEKTAI
jgi:hypothetical protein